MVSLSSAESELYAAVKSASEGLGIQSVAKDLGISCGPNLHLDASATMYLVNRRGLGKAKHVDMQNLWVQEASKSGRFVTKKVGTCEDPADLMTKPIPKARIEQLMSLLGLRVHEIRGGHVEESIGMVGASKRVMWMVHIKDKAVHKATFRSLGNVASDARGISGLWRGLRQSGCCWFQLWVRAEVSVGRVVNAAVVSFCKRAEIARASGGVVCRAMGGPERGEGINQECCKVPAWWELYAS